MPTQQIFGFSKLIKFLTENNGYLLCLSQDINSFICCKADGCKGEGVGDGQEEDEEVLGYIDPVLQMAKAISNSVKKFNGGFSPGRYWKYHLLLMITNYI